MKKYICLLLLLGSLQGFSQDIAEVTSTCLLKNAQLIARPGAIPMVNHILIKDGVITKVSPSITAPFDAKVIDLDSMYVYAGFIDAYSHTGIKKQEGKEDKPKAPGLATLHQSGVRPQVSAKDQMSIKESAIEKMNKAGFVISHVMPSGRMIPGTSTIISLQKKKSIDQMVLNPSFAMSAQLKGASGAAPATVIGVMAKFRDVLNNAEIAKQQHQAYSSNPTGMVRPQYSTEMQSLIPVVDNKMPVFFNTSSPKRILRAQTLQKEHGFDMVLCEVKNIYPVIDQVKKANNTVLLSLDLPKEIKKKEDKKEDDEDKKEVKEDESDKKKETASDSEKEDEDPEVAALKKRRQMAYDQNLSQAAMLESKGINFAFSYDKVKTGDIISNINRMIEAGLSEKAALAALTTSPAQILNVSKVAGTVEQGKLANLVITDKPLFEEKSKIAYVITEGNVQKMKTKANKKAAKSDGKTILAGTWSYELEVMGQTESGKIIMTKSGDSYTFTLESDSSEDGPDEASKVEVNGENVKATVPVEMGQMVDLLFDLDFSGSSFEGTVSLGEFGTYDISGDKTDPKK